MANPDADETCSGTAYLFRAAREFFPAADVVPEFMNFATDEDTMTAWIAKSRLAEDPADVETLGRAMLGSSYTCIRCEAIQRAWYAGSDSLGAWFKAPEAEPLLQLWAQVKRENESFMRAFRKGNYARIQVESGQARGYYVYFELREGRWSYACRSGFWVA